MSLDGLLEDAYRLGEGDPWAGVRIIDGRTEQSLDGAKDAPRVLRARLRPAATADERAAFIDGRRIA